MAARTDSRRRSRLQQGSVACWKQLVTWIPFGGLCFFKDGVLDAASGAGARLTVLSLLCVQEPWAARQCRVLGVE